MHAALLRLARRAAPAALLAAGGAAYAASSPAHTTPLAALEPAGAAPEGPAPAAAGGSPGQDDCEVLPTGLHLIHAQVLFRHGHRTPIHVHHAVDHTAGWPLAPALPAEAPSVVVVNANVRAAPAAAAAAATAGLRGRSWATNLSGRPALTHTLPSPPLARRAQTDEAMPFPRQESANTPLRFGTAGIPGGRLTPTGVAHLTAVGRSLRRRYVTEGGLLPPTFDPSLVYLRCVAGAAGRAPALPRQQAALRACPHALRAVLPCSPCARARAHTRAPHCAPHRRTHPLHTPLPAPCPPHHQRLQHDARQPHAHVAAVAAGGHVPHVPGRL